MDKSNKKREAEEVGGEEEGEEGGDRQQANKIHFAQPAIGK